MKAQARARAGDDSAVIARGTRVRGRIEGTGALAVGGEVAGAVQLEGPLSIESGGAIHGNVSASSVRVEGGLLGDVVAEGPVLICAGAQVEGNMQGSEIALEEGASFTGRIEADFDLPDGLAG